VTTDASTLTGRTAGELPAFAAPVKGIRAFLSVFVFLWIFSSGFVFIEPSPYEVMFLLVLPLVPLAGLGLHRGTTPLFVLLALFVPFALIAAFQVQFSEIWEAMLYSGVTVFLWFTGYFVANYVADAPQRHMRLIIRAYTAVAVLSALVGTLAYLGLMPKADFFVLYGRAKALFKDPNVFAPFLVLPAMFALQRIFLGNLRQVIVGGMIFGILFVGVFVSFSRAGWGYFALSSVLTFALIFTLEANAREKLKMMIMAFAGVAVLATVLVGLLSVPEVSRLFEQRASLSQSYDTGETGRFGRQAYAFDLALQNPLGIGPLEFRNLRIVEEPHNTYINVLHAYGWGGGACLIALIIMTLWKGGNALTRAGPRRLLLVPVIATYIPLVLQAAIIDIDHWRHFYLLAGLVWGLSAAGSQRFTPLPRSRALI